MHWPISARAFVDGLVEPGLAARLGLAVRGSRRSGVVSAKVVRDRSGDPALPAARSAPDDEAILEVVPSNPTDGTRTIVAGDDAARPGHVTSGRALLTHPPLKGDRSTVLSQALAEEESPPEPASGRRRLGGKRRFDGGGVGG